jgi:L-lactate dehydrogenase
MRGIGRRIVLVDRNGARARAEADDLLDAVPFANPFDVVTGGYPDLAGASAVILTAGVGQRPGETRPQLSEASPSPASSRRCCATSGRPAAPRSRVPLA